MSEPRYVVQQEPVQQVVQPAPRVVQSEVIETEHVVRHTRGAFSGAQVIHALCGLALVVLGAVTVGKAGFGGPIGERTTEVLGITSTTLIGLVELAAGLLLLLAAISPAGRGFGGAIGVMLLVGGIVIAVGSDELLSDMHTESALGWIGIIVGALALIGAFLPSHVVSRRTAVDVR